MLIKSVLSSMPIFQSAILVAPKGNLTKIKSLLRIFLWKGGKHNENMLHLISWGKRSKPIIEGGLQVRDLRFQNLAMGAKIICGI